jgi:hypothetical protein
MHFHLAATINAATDIPLVPAMNSSGDAGGVVHKVPLNDMEVKSSLRMYLSGYPA